MSVLFYECICRRKQPHSGWKRTGLHVSASTGWKCTVQGQNATVQFGMSVSVQSRPFRVRMPVWCISSDFQCHNVTVQGRKCTVPMKSNDAFWHKRVSFDTGPEAPIERFGTDDRRVETTDRYFWLPYPSDTPTTPLDEASNCEVFITTSSEACTSCDLERAWIFLLQVELKMWIEDFKSLQDQFELN